MLEELAVRDLGVVGELSLVFGPGMTAVTGETGAGKTLIVEAIELLVGGRADSTMVRPGATRAEIEGRFVLLGEEVVLRRVIPVDGRSRAYVNGSLATAGTLTELGEQLVDLHGQHDHQSLLRMAAQRRALDVFAGIDLEPLRRAREAVAATEERLAALGGDDRARAREVDLLRFQLEELVKAGIDDPFEDGRLEAEEDLLAGAAAHRDAAAGALGSLVGESGAVDAVALAVGALQGRSPFADTESRLRGLAAELADISSDLRVLAESIDDDPDQLASVRDRRRCLFELRRKYGETLADVIAYRDEITGRLDELESRDELARSLDLARERLEGEVRRIESEVGAARRAGAPVLAREVTSNLATLAMKKARIEITVGDDPGDEVSFRLAANPGSPVLPLAKVASGGELARTMLALRLVLSDAPPTLVFDEVDAGIGGTAAVSLGRSLARLGGKHQVLVVTHLAQVAAFADQHVVVEKVQHRAETTTLATPVRGDEREAEVARMLSGSSSTTALQHARELLAQGAGERERARR